MTEFVAFLSTAVLQLSDPVVLAGALVTVLILSGLFVVGSVGVAPRRHRRPR